MTAGFASRGRGARYTLRRGLVESMLRVAYAGDWPARAWARVPGACRVRTVQRELAVLPPGTPPLRIGFASDLHLGPTTPEPLLDAAFEALARAELDVLLLGGDYVFLDATPPKARRLAELVRRANARRTFAVMGNHDLWTDHPLLERALASAGATVLENAGLRLDGPHAGVWVAGVDDPWTGFPDAARAFAGARPSDVRVAFSHAPEAVVDVAARGAHLLLVGHTHGGHVALPGGIPIVVPGPLGRAHPAGWYQVGTTMLGVSRGVGGIELALRAFAPPDVVRVDLVPVRTPSRS